jgi:nitrogen fixation NifU-like protein
MSDKPKNDFWQTHSERFLEMALRTDHQEVLHNADGLGKKTGDCGDTVTFFLMVNHGRISNASYVLQGCIHTNACANAIIEMIQGRSIAEAWEIDPESVSETLKTLPIDHFHCAELAVGALYLALSDLRANRKSPWKKSYR